MRVAEPSVSASSTGDWGEQTRRVLTRDLLVRAAQVPHGEGRALQFRALHLNLPLVAEVARRLGLTRALVADVEHAGLEGLLDAVRRYDPYGDAEFTAFAAPYVEGRIRALVPSRAVSVRTPRPTRR